MQALEIRCYRSILSILYLNRITNDAERDTIRQEKGPWENRIDIVKRRKLKWDGYFIRANTLSIDVLVGTNLGRRKRNKKRGNWFGNDTEWTGRILHRHRHWQATETYGGNWSAAEHPRVIMGLMMMMMMICWLANIKCWFYYEIHFLRSATPKI